MVKRILILSAAVGAALALLGTPASAQYGGAFSATIDDTTVVAGQTVNIAGVCEDADEVGVSFDGNSIGTIPVNDDDTFSGDVTIPEVDPGTSTLTATCGDQVLSIEVTVGDGGGGDDGPMGPGDGATGDGAGADGDGTGDGALARTGFDTDSLLKVGGGLVLAGAAFTLFATKRRSATA